MENESNFGSSISQDQEQNAQPLKPSSNMVLAIVTTVCRCLPFGIVGIIKASKVNSLYIAKQYSAAQKSADDAKKWSIIGIVTGLVVYVIYLAVYGGTILATLKESDF